MEYRIPKWLYHCYKIYCEKGGHCRKQAYMVDKKCTMEMYFPDKWTWHMIVHPVLTPLSIWTVKKIMLLTTNIYFICRMFIRTMYWLTVFWRLRKTCIIPCSFRSLYRALFILYHLLQSLKMMKLLMLLFILDYPNFVLHSEEI